MRTLRGRLTLTYAVALAMGLCIFAAVSLGVIDKNVKAMLDARLTTAARAFVTTLAMRKDKATIDASTRRRLISILGVQQNGAVLLGGRAIGMQNVAVPREVEQAAAAARRGQLTYATVMASGTPLRVVAIRLSDRRLPEAVVVLWRSTDVLSDYERTGELVSAAAIVFILSAASFIGNLIARRGLEPLRAMATVASEIEARDLSRRLMVTTQNDELGILAMTFNRMLDRLQASFERQRQFTADASHDLRAPLSVICAEIDLALRREPETSDRQALLSIRGEAMQLEHLLEDLLLAARVDTGPMSQEAIVLSTVIATAVQGIATFAASRSVRIWHESETHTLVVGDHKLLDRVLLSLFHNAVKFAPEHGNVWTSTRLAGEYVECTICDDGPGFSQEALLHAFDRFWRGDEARDNNGTGLGLAIAKTVIDRLRGEIHIQNSSFGGAKVTISLPIVSSNYSHDTQKDAVLESRRSTVEGG